LEDFSDKDIIIRSLNKFKGAVGNEQLFRHIDGADMAIAIINKQVEIGNHLIVKLVYFDGPDIGLFESAEYFE
jgi:hypothetical protein